MTPEGGAPPDLSVTIETYYNPLLKKLRGKKTSGSSGAGQMAMLRQLPNRTEVADLLVDVSQTGLAAGLEFELFKPQGEVPKDFYAELPIKLRVVGNYHEFGEFVSGLAALPRIVTVHDVKIKPRGRGSSQLLLEATAKTYRYLDEAGG